MMRAMFVILLSIAVTGCVFKPDSAGEERIKLDANREKFAYPSTQRSERVFPVLPNSPEWRDILHRAFIANGELESSFHEWTMAVERIDQAGTWPTQNVELGFDYMFSAEQMKTFDRMTFSAGLMDASALPNKTYANATVAWRDAQAAGERFRAAKFDLQMRVLQAWADYALQAERVRIQEQNLSLLQLVSDTAASRVRAGGPQQDQLRADVQLRLAANELATTKATLDQQRAALNALLQRAPTDPLPPPITLPMPRPIAASDEALLAAGVENNPELAALGFDAKAREVAIQRARMEYLPEINPMAAFTGSVSQSLGAAITLPTQLPRIQGMVAEARADLRRVEAMSRQTRSDRAGKFAATLVALRDAERRAAVFDSEVLPLAQQTVELTRRGYGAGTATYLDVIDTQRTLLDVRLLAAEAKTMRERMLAELEALAGMDVETVRSEE